MPQPALTLYRRNPEKTAFQAAPNRHGFCRGRHVSHPYTPYCPTFDYVGRHHYFLTFVTYSRRRVFTAADVVDLALTQILRAAEKHSFKVIAYCFMPDHVHLVVEGLSDDSNLKSFAKLAKQYAGYYYARAHSGAKLWQHGTNDHIIRDHVDLLDRVRYVLHNPVAAGMVTKPEDYPFQGSQSFSIRALNDWRPDRFHR